MNENFVVCLFSGLFFLYAVTVWKYRGDKSPKLTNVVVSPHLSNWSYHDVDTFNFSNGPHVRQWLASVPGNWRYPLVFLINADEKYIDSVFLFVESMETYGILKDDIIVVCITQLCVASLNKHRITTRLYRDPICVNERNNDTRCLVSTAKFTSIRDFLSQNMSVFYFDLDVYFKKNPLPNKLKSSVDMYAQFNSAYEIDKYNFGIFLIRPSKGSINLFHAGLLEFLETLEFDQKIFNRQVIASGISGEWFPRDKYVSLSRERFFFDLLDRDRITLIHMTCAEGAENKFLLGRSVFGILNTPSFYEDERKVITISFDKSLTQEQLIGLLFLSIQACSALAVNGKKRKLRLVNWHYLTQTYGDILMKSLYDADLLLNEQDIILLEKDYWKGVSHFDSIRNSSSRRIVKTESVPIWDLESIYRVFKNSSLADIDDVILDIRSYSLLSTLSSAKTDILTFNNHTDIRESEYNESVFSFYSPYLCKAYASTIWGCTKMCNGHHF